jgi:hypothetical protein
VPAAAGEGSEKVNIPKTAQKIARTFWRLGYNSQSVVHTPSGYLVTLEGEETNVQGGYDVIEVKALSVLEAFRQCMAIWKEER